LSKKKSRKGRKMSINVRCRKSYRKRGGVRKNFRSKRLRGGSEKSEDDGKSLPAGPLTRVENLAFRKTLKSYLEGLSEYNEDGTHPATIDFLQGELGWMKSGRRSVMWDDNYEIEKDPQFISFLGKYLKKKNIKFTDAEEQLFSRTLNGPMYYGAAPGHPDPQAHKHRHNVSLTPDDLRILNDILLAISFDLTPEKKALLRKIGADIK